MKQHSIKRPSRWMRVAFLSFVICHLSVSVALAQRTVGGTVTDAATGRPLAGVIVEAYGQHQYTAMTDENGKYQLDVPEYVNSVSMRVEGYQLLQKAIGSDPNSVDARLYPSTFSPIYERTTQSTESRRADQFDNTVHWWYQQPAGQCTAPGGHRRCHYRHAV